MDIDTNMYMHVQCVMQTIIGTTAKQDSQKFNTSCLCQYLYWQHVNATQQAEENFSFLETNRRLRSCFTDCDFLGNELAILITYKNFYLTMIYWCH